MNESLTPVQPTEDMRLPAGSAVFQIINAPLEDGTPNLDMRGVLVGGPDGPVSYDPTNPAHRLVAVIGNRIDELVAEATGGAATRRTDAGVIERRLHPGEQPGAIPEEGLDPVSLSRGTPVQPMQHELAGHASLGSDPGIEPGIVAGYDLSDANLARERHELTETEAARQDKLAALALQYNSSGNPKEHFELADRAEGKGGSGLHPDD